MTELMYDVPVIPDGIDIYETYHPGAVVRILACNANPVSSDDRNRKPGEVEWVNISLQMHVGNNIIFISLTL